MVVTHGASLSVVLNRAAPTPSSRKPTGKGEGGQGRLAFLTNTRVVTNIGEPQRMEPRLLF